MFEIEVVVLNLKCCLLGVIVIVVCLILVQVCMIGIVVIGLGLLFELLYILLLCVVSLFCDCWCVWYVCCNMEMVLGLILCYVLWWWYWLLFILVVQCRYIGFMCWLVCCQDVLIVILLQVVSYLECLVIVILYGVDLDVFYFVFDCVVLCDWLGFVFEDIVIGCFGWVCVQKGVDLLVQVVLWLFLDRFCVWLIFLGWVMLDNQVFIDDLKVWIVVVGFLDCICFLGEVLWEQVVQNYQVLDLFVVFVWWEGFGLILLEVVVCGVLIVVVCVGVYEVLICDGEIGSLVVCEDVDVLIMVLVYWLDDDVVWIVVGQVVCVYVVIYYVIEVEVCVIVGVY